MSADDPLRRRDLGAFLRARREGLAVEAAGRRRRTPGLRREEVADLAGISAVWYARIEQGREVFPSPLALARIAEALRLGRAERAHLFDLAARRDPAAVAHDVPANLPAGLSEAAAASRAPSYVLDGLWTVRLRNEAADALFVDWRGEAEPNLLRYVFLDPAARRFILGWEERARRLAAEFRMDLARRPGESAGALVAELAAAEPFFAECWKEQRVTSREGGLRSFDHPRRGRLEFRQATFVTSEEPDFKLVMLLDVPS